jgi:hypothetical protein
MTTAGSTMPTRTVTPVPRADRASGEEEQVLGQPDEPIHFLQALPDRAGVFVGRPGVAERDLQSALQGRQRGAELMGRVSREAPQLGEGRIQPGQYRVQRVGQIIQLVAGASAGNPAGEIRGGDLPRLSGHCPDGGQRSACDPGASYGSQSQAKGEQGQQDLQIPPERRLHPPEGHPDLDQPGGPALPPDGQCYQPRALLPGQRHGLERLASADRVPAGLGRQWQRAAQAR